MCHFVVRPGTRFSAAEASEARNTLVHRTGCPVAWEAVASRKGSLQRCSLLRDGRFPLEQGSGLFRARRSPGLGSRGRVIDPGVCDPPRGNPPGNRRAHP